MLKPLLPQGIAFSILKEDSLSSFSPSALEQRLASVMRSEAARNKFLLGRSAAHAALKQLGIVSPFEIDRGSHREPVWPEGIVGSIAHAGEFGCAAVGRLTQYSAIGVDIELLTGAHSQIQKRIAHPEELEWLNAVKGEEELRTIILFSAKEALFKALYPVLKTYFGFLDALITPRGSLTTLEAKLLFDTTHSFPAETTFEITVSKDNYYVLTFLAVAGSVVKRS